MTAKSIILNIARDTYSMINNDMIYIENFNPSLLEIKKLSCMGVSSLNIYYIKYIPMKTPDEYDKDFLYFIFNNVEGYIQENNGIKYLVKASTNKNKNALKNYIKLWEETTSQIEVINDDKPIKYKKDFINIRF